MGDNPDLVDKLPFAKQVKEIKNIQSQTKMYWFIEPNVEITDADILDYRPAEHDSVYEHIWKWDANNYGGVRLLPQGKSLGIKEVNQVVCKKSFAILNTPDPGNYFTEHLYADYVWCVDPEYKLSDSIDWAPSNFEPEFIHSFHLRGQLEHRYPEREGGIKLYPRSWEKADTKYHGFLDASAKYPVMFVEDPEDYAQRDVYDDDYVWLIDKEYKINPATLDWVPSPFEDEYVHSFRMYYQLQEKTWSYKHPTNDRRLGGIRLVPRDWKKAFDLIENGLIIHNDCPIEDKSYDVFYVDETEFTAEVYEEYAQRSRTDWFWIVDRDFEFNGKLLYVPTQHEQEYIHVFKIPGHMEYRYPAENQDAWDIRCGGVRLVSKSFDFTKHKHQDGVVPVKYDIFFVDNHQNFNTIAKKSRTKMFWSIDSEHSISQILKYVPTRDEQKYLLNFKIADQLKHKYPDKEGGVYLVPKSINENTSIKYKGNLSVKNKEYPILYVQDVEDLSVVTEDCWLIDKEYQIDDDIDWTPSSFESRHIHTFHVPGQLKHKYPDAMGGVRWVPVEWSNEYVIHDDLPVKPKKYPVILVADPNDYTQAKGQCWLIDKEYQIDQDFEWVPSNFEKDFIHTFHVAGQLTHKYPDEIGGIRWVPFDWENAETKIHKDSPFTKPVFEKYITEEEGREQTTKDWFWVIEPDVDVNSDFDFNFVPDIWDSGKTHVWQVANPVTGLNYDYAGVKLCHREAKSGRPKYIKEIASTQKAYDVLHLNAKLDILEQLNGYHSSTKMYWAIDPWVELHPDFKFDMYPTQWDQDCVHVFMDHQGVHRNVRLVPAGYQFESLEQITNNSYPKLKQHNIIASVTPQWSVYDLKKYTSKELQNIAQSETKPWFFTVDFDVETTHNLSYEPNINDQGKVHAWQRLNPHTGKVHSYGGVRLWPTEHINNITTDNIKLNKIPGLRYVRQPLSAYKPYPIVLLSYHEERAQTAFDALLKRSDNVLWVRDIDGIFEAHKEAAKLARDATMFWVVDADAELTADFDFSYIPDVYDQETVHVWASMNPVTGSKYGYGGVKLFNTKQVSDSTSWGLDFTTGLSKRFKFMPEVSCTTLFNTSAYDTWRSAFREVVKLSVSTDPDAKYRIEEWLNPLADAEYGTDALRGAQQAQKFAQQNTNNLSELSKINDYEWLQKKFRDHGNS